MSYKTILIPIKCSKLDLNYLYNCNKLSAEVWNYCVKIDSQCKEITGKQIKFLDLQKLIKGIVPLHSKVIQHTMRKYLDCREAMWKSILVKHKESNKVKLPYKIKKYFTSGWDYQSIRVDYDNGIIKLSKGKVGGKSVERVKCYAKTIPQNIVEIEIVYKHKLLLAIKYKEEDNYKQIESNNEASIDLGEIHAITSIDNNGNAIIITGRKLRSDKRLRNKEQGRLRQRMGRCTKGSNQYKKYKRALNNLAHRFKRKELDNIHKITKLYVDYCTQRDISKIYYGDLDNCTRDTKGRIGKMVGQKLHEWDYGLLMLQLENKLSRHGIKLAKISEAYSSQLCPVCGHKTKAKGRNYTCGYCDYTMHRDVNGAINILNMNSDFHIYKYSELKYLRIA